MRHKWIQHLGGSWGGRCTWFFLVKKHIMETQGLLHVLFLLGDFFNITKKHRLSNNMTDFLSHFLHIIVFLFSVIIDFFETTFLKLIWLALVSPKLILPVFQRCEFQKFFPSRRGASSSKKRFLTPMYCVNSFFSWWFVLYTKFYFATGWWRSGQGDFLTWMIPIQVGDFVFAGDVLRTRSHGINYNKNHHCFQFFPSIQQSQIEVGCILIVPIR